MLASVRPFVSALIVVLASGCGLVLDTDPGPDGGGVADGSTNDSFARDSDPGDVGEMDAIPPIRDAMTTDGPSPTDARIDASPPCLPPASDPAVVAHYTFDSDPPSRISDQTGNHHGSLTDGVVHVPGVCGDAIAFPAAGEIPHGKISDNPAFHIAEGSLELYVRVAAHDNFGILSRDEQSAREPGHLSIYTGEDGYLIVRLQDMEPEDNAVWLCSNTPVRVGAWTHIGVSWGGDQLVQLWVDGVLATNSSRDTVFINSGTTRLAAFCGDSVRNLGIDGAALSWILGANASLRRATMPEYYTVPFVDGAIDELVIRNVRRDFSRR